MAKMFEVKFGMEGFDEEFLAGVKEEHEGVYGFEQDNGIGKLVMGKMTLDELLTAVDKVGDELSGDEIDELEGMKVGDEAEFDRGRGGWYEIKAVA